MLYLLSEAEVQAGGGRGLVSRGLVRGVGTRGREAKIRQEEAFTCFTGFTCFTCARTEGALHYVSRSEGFRQ